MRKRPWGWISLGALTGALALTGCQQPDGASDSSAAPAVSVSSAAPPIEADQPAANAAEPTGEAPAVRAPDLVATLIAKHTSETGSTDVGGGLQKLQSAVTTSEVTIQSAGDASMAETASAVMTASDGTNQTVVTSNIIGSGGNELGRVDFGCFRGTTTQCQYGVNYAPAGSDPSMVTGADGNMYEQRLTASGGMWIRNNNPCPSGCGAGGFSWAACTANFSIDWSMLSFADSSGHVWGVHNDFGDSIFDAVAVNKLTWCSSISWFSRAVQCGTTGLSKNKRNPHAVLGGGNLLHVVYANITDQVVEHTTFNTSTNTWSCTNNVIGAIVVPSTPFCSGSGSTHVMPGLGNSNLEYDAAPRIARDPSSGIMVATWDSYDVAIAKVRGRAYTSSDGGTTWVNTLVTAEETGKSSVAFGTAATFEIGNTYKDASTHQGAQVRWISTNDGSSWTGNFISVFRSFRPIAAAQRACFWGDYDAVTWNGAQSAFFHSWYDSNFGPRTVIRGRFYQN